MHFNISDYHNYLDNIHLSVEDVEIQLMGLTYRGNPAKSDEIENAYIGTMVEAFYNHIIAYGHIPSQDLFYYDYTILNALKYQEVLRGVNSRLSFTTRKECLRARIVSRTYPSLIRDLYFCLLCREKQTDYSVLYNPHLDAERGIDILLSKSERHVGLCLYQDTDEGKAQLERKKAKRKKYDNLEFKDCPLIEHGSKQIGNIYLFSEAEYDGVIRQVKAILH